MSRYLSLIPAAGAGSRMGQTLPKQYLPILNRPLLHHSIARLCAHALVERVYVVLAADDRRFDKYDWNPFGAKLVPLYAGGGSRAETVRNGLQRIETEVAVDDWILVHDAARPCVTPALLDRLIGEIGADQTGGLLAVPLADTLKRANSGARVVATEPRAGLWQAQTPQMFRYGLLTRALRSVDLADITDEASAIERLGMQPRLVASHITNLKVTYPEDLALAELILKNT
ncbi:MAG TPA: 2-C-methyl-D-erythritol 4-phosphate cytidylyltransferase [Burkholderiales bacterium]|jgi:2-C-methyl-D-erythritol 4-phosphate cytidylyltransferase|nr:2-C-methyl-D-erythritol 4-phosphate cytidylyltransferase [Burkholderiales bacterium]